MTICYNLHAYTTKWKLISTYVSIKMILQVAKLSIENLTNCKGKVAAELRN